jgi:signal transduction histidine kinase
MVVSGALGWAGWRLLHQQAVIDQQHARDQADSVADAVAAGIRGRLAEAGERLTGWVSNPSAAVPVIDDAVVVGARADGTHVSSAGQLPFVPGTLQAPSVTNTFATLEAMEFGGAPGRALDGYRTLAGHREPEVRAGALVRLGRSQRKAQDFPSALVTYQRLAELGTVRTDNLPAELASLSGQRSTYIAMSAPEQANNIGRRVLTGLDSGRWLIDRGTAELYREPFTEPRPESWRFASALSEVWRDPTVRLSTRGQRVFASDHSPAASVLVLWRSNGTYSAALAASVDRFFDVPAAKAAGWQLVEPDGRVIGGRPAAPARPVVRIIGNSDYPWTLHTWIDPSGAAAARSRRPILMAMMIAMLAFVWAASYFMARAIWHEAAVAQLQSNFVAGVSHEFRSPLTAVRQMAEMLDADRVQTEERRHQYYRMLAAEATRLQRLVETLLTFGQLEARAQRYRFVAVDAAALVREVVDDIEPRARESGTSIAMHAADSDVLLRADQGALSVALANLIDNAIKYSPGEPTVWVRWHKDHDRAVISVVDRGVGIPPSEHRSIFGKFVRGRGAIDANITGTGVGLAIVQQIVSAHGGEVRVESEPGQGSTFTLLLPGAH